MIRILTVVLTLLAPLAVWAEDRVPTSQADISLSFAPVVKTAAPAVVNIYAKRVVQTRVSPFANDPFFRDLFRGQGRVVPRVQNSLGSGVIVSPDGLVVSNFHVVGEATEIRVVLTDRREYDATVVLADEESDLAILRMDGATDLPALSLRNSDEVEVGDLVLAIGNPFGIGQTVSSGIVSGLARSGVHVGGGRGYFIQTDAAINPGNSGGALVDGAGRLVGINTAILSRSGGSNGIGFAIPANLVRQFITQAERGNDRFVRPWAGVSGQAVDAALAEALGLDRPAGIVLNALHPDSPFGAAGLQVGDVILSLGGQEVNTPQEMMFRMALTGENATAEVIGLRDGDPFATTVTLTPPPEVPARDLRQFGDRAFPGGLEVSNINPAVVAEHNLPAEAAGVLVTAIGQGNARPVLQPGDILLGINGARINDTGDVDRALRRAGDRMSVEYLRNGQRGIVSFRR